MSAETPALRGEAATTTAEAGARARLRSAGRVAVAAVVIGLVGQLLFFGVGVGINFPLAIGIALGGAWLLRPRAATFDRLDAWLPATALVLAVFVGVRGDPVLVFFDILASLGLTTAALAAIGGHAVTRRLLPGVAALVGRVVGWTAFSAPSVISDAAVAVRPGEATRGRLARARPFLRGLLIALPVVVVFTALFAAADAVFATIVGDLFDVQLDLGELPGRLFVAAVIAWMAAGALAFVADAPSQADPVVGDRFRFLGSTEAIVVLVAVDAVFLVFVALQAAYLFGGLDTLAASGLTYAEYARRGFFELLAVAALAGGLVLVGEAVIQRRSRAYVAGAIGLMVLTAVVLASAFLRLRLYQDAYGWTELRFYVLASIGWLALGIGMAIAALWLDRSRWLVHGLVMAAALVGLAINVIGPVRHVAEQNVARALNPALVAPDGRSGLDAEYISGLGHDAVPAIISALPALPEHTRRTLESVLSSRRWELASPETQAWQAWNLGRERARDLLGGP